MARHSRARDSNLEFNADSSTFKPHIIEDDVITIRNAASLFGLTCLWFISFIALSSGNGENVVAVQMETLFSPFEEIQYYRSQYAMAVIHFVVGFVTGVLAFAIVNSPHKMRWLIGLAVILSGIAVWLDVASAFFEMESWRARLTRIFIELIPGISIILGGLSSQWLVTNIFRSDKFS